MITMKNQYFGDTQDLFKYDLAMHCMEHAGLSRLTFVPMLTPDDGSADGRHVDLGKARAGRENGALVDFLEACTREGRRDIGELDRFVAGTPYQLLTWDRLLEEDRRLLYWLDLPRGWLEDAVVVVDPDNGMEVPSGRGVKWLRYDELRYLYENLGEGSVLLIFQFIPRVKRAVFVPEVARRMVERAGMGEVQWVTDWHVVFYAMGDAGGSIVAYGEGYGLDVGSRP